MRKLTTVKSRMKELAREANRYRVHQGRLAEDYDGIGQHIMVILSGGSTSGALRARVASADFGTGQLIPRGSPVSVFVAHGKIEIMSMGYKLVAPVPPIPTWQEEWLTGTTYGAGAIVFWEGNVYQANTSTSSEPPGADWDLLFSSGAPLLLNTGFEVPDLSVNTFAYNPTGATWLFTSSAGIASNGSPISGSVDPAPEGTQYGFIQNINQSIRQTMPGFILGASYQVFFKAGVRSGYNDGPQTVEVYLANNLIGSFTPTYNSPSWTAYSTSSIATIPSGPQELKFLNTVSGDRTVFIDDVRITQTL